MATTHGGARQGAGRKTTREKHAPAITRAEKQIADNLPMVVGKMLELAAGVRVMTFDKDGGEVVYKEKPDFRAASYLIDRILGKPITPTETTISGPGGGAIPLGFDQSLQRAYGAGIVVGAASTVNPDGDEDTDEEPAS